MRMRGLLAGAVAALGILLLAGCDNTQGTSANPDLVRESAAYSNNDDPQNTGAGSGSVVKPPAPTANQSNGETPSLEHVKGTDDATGAYRPR